MPNLSFFDNLIKKGNNYVSRNWKNLPSEVSEELVQSVVAKLYSNRNFLDLIPSDKRGAYSYFYRSLRNRIINYLKRENRDLPLKSWAKTTFRDPLFYAIMVETEIMSHDLVDEIFEMEKLSSDLYLVYLLYFKNLTLERLGWLAGLSKSTVDYRVKTAIEKLNKILSSRGFVYIFQYKVFLRVLFDRMGVEEFERDWRLSNLQSIVSRKVPFPN